MATTSLLRRPSPLTDDDVTAGAGVPSTPAGAPATPTLSRTPFAFGGAQASDARSIGALASKPDPSLSPAAAVGTRIGRAIGGESRDVINGGVDLVNAGRDVGAGIVNTLTAPVRYAAPVARDVYNGIAGNPEAPDAGSPLAGANPAPLSRPFPSGGSPAASGDVPNPASVSFAGVVPFASGADAGAAVDGNQASIRRASLFAGVQGSGLGTGKGDLPSDVYGGVTTQDGRRLSYGAMVNGVPTFSDGSSGVPGVAGSIPRTMTNETIKSLGARLQTAPAPVAPLASDSLGYTPSSEQEAALRRPTAVPVTGSRPSAAQFAASDRDAIASGDWRSSAGTVAHNLQMDAQYAGTPRLRRAAAGALGAQLAGALHAGEQAVAGDNDAANGESQRAGALALENLRGQYGLQQGAMETARSLLTRQLPQTTLSDGTIAQIGQNGVVTPTRLPDGSPARAAVTRDDSGTRRENDLLDQLTKGVQSQMDEHIKAQALLPDDQRTPVTPKQIADWRGLQARAIGLPLVANPKSGEQMVFLNGSWRAL